MTEIILLILIVVGAYMVYGFARQLIDRRELTNNGNLIFRCTQLVSVLLQCDDAHVVKRTPTTIIISGNADVLVNGKKIGLTNDYTFIISHRYNKRLVVTFKPTKNSYPKEWTFKEETRINSIVAQMSNVLIPLGVDVKKYLK